MLSRREFTLAGVALPVIAAQPSGWTPEWDRALIDAHAATLDGAFDPAERMLRRKLGDEYIYHSGLRNTVVHPTRESLDYALLMLQAGGDERARRAEAVIDRILGLQDTNAESKWYGIWGWYMEEPPPKMVPAADWNWADFLGSLLLLIENRHGSRIAEPLRRRIRDGIRHAAHSVRRRNVSMTYTNIAVQGTFVTLAAAELLDDRTLMAYATERLRRFAATVDETGSFAEYNSPTYANVTIANLTRIRMLVKHEPSRELAARIHERAWQHLGKHWHAPSRQLAGPMSRCYRTDIGQPLWLQKSLGGRLEFATLADIRERRTPASTEVATLDYRCPDSVAPMFLDTSAPPRQHRELFRPSVQGTTWLDRRHTIGSANRGTFWVQSRPVLGYWGERMRTGGYLQMRCVKDDYDFASALVYTVQQRNCILGLLTFRTPGGDKHPSLDPVRDGQFRASRLRLRCDVNGASESARHLSDEDSVTVDAGAVKFWLRFPRSAFGARTGRVSLERAGGLLAVSFDLLNEKQPVTVRWAELPGAFAVFQLVMEDSSESLARFAGRMRATAFRAVNDAEWEWESPAGTLTLAGSVAPAAIADQDRAFRDRIDGKPVPLVRLSEDRLV